MPLFNCLRKHTANKQRKKTETETEETISWQFYLIFLLWSYGLFVISFELLMVGGVDVLYIFFFQPKTATSTQRQGTTLLFIIL